MLRGGGDLLREAMARVPQAVCVVSVKGRGVTCSSLASVSLQPPVVSVSLKNSNHINSMLTSKYAINILSTEQIREAIHFAQPVPKALFDLKFDQFAGIDSVEDEKGEIRYLNNCCCVLFCQLIKSHDIGDHSVWYGKVDEIKVSGDKKPLIHCSSRFWSVGDQLFMDSFENQTLPFSEWTHVAHMRMAWNYLSSKSKAEATILIREGIKKFNAQNAALVQRGYHETITLFFIDVVHSRLAEKNSETFEQFIERNSEIISKDFLSKYYSNERLADREAFVKYLPPDRSEIFQ